MQNAILEHVNLTVTDPNITATLLTALFGWKIRWSGQALDQGYTVHVGSETSYLALYAPPSPPAPSKGNHLSLLNLNHLGVMVDDIDEVERKVIAHKLTPFNHGNYQPGQRFYFLIDDQLEIEVVQYTP